MSCNPANGTWMQKYLLLFFDDGWPKKYQLHNLGLNEVLSADQDPSPKECAWEMINVVCKTASAVEKEKEYQLFSLHRAALATSKSWVSVHSKIDLNVT
jgi:hypothetical protein